MKEALLKFTFCVIVAAVAGEFRCAKLDRNLKDIASFIYRPFDSNQSEICRGSNVCRSVWVQDRSNIVLLKQGCRNVNDLETEFSQDCGEDKCLQFFAMNTSYTTCPIGPQAVCCCKQPMCNKNIVPYKFKCTLPKRRTITTPDLPQESYFTHKIVVGIAFVGIALALLVFIAYVAGVVCKRIKANRQAARRDASPNKTNFSRSREKIGLHHYSLHGPGSSQRASGKQEKSLTNFYSMSVKDFIRPGASIKQTCSCCVDEDTGQSLDSRNECFSPECDVTLHSPTTKNKKRTTKVAADGCNVHIV